MKVSAVLLLLATSVASGVQIQHHDPMEAVGNTAGTVGSTASDVASPVAEPVGDAAGAGTTAVGDGIGDTAVGVGKAAGAKGDNPAEKLPIVGDSFKVHPVSTSINCVVSLTIQYMIVYTAAAVVRTVGDIYNLKYEHMPIQKILHSATLTVNYAPMLAVLFLATRMRVTWLTQGQGNPPTYIQVWMYSCTYSVLLMTVIVCVIPLFTGDVIGVDQRTGDIKQDARPFKNWMLAGCFTVLKFLIMLGLYVGAICIVYGTINYVPEKHLAVHGELPPVSPAVQCTMILTAQFFLVYAAMQVARTWTQFTATEGAEIQPTKFETVMYTATHSMNFAPMMSVLFIGARMRALQMDPLNGAPQGWAQNCFFMCTYALLAQTIISIAVPYVLLGDAKKSETIEGDMVYDVKNRVLGGCLTVARYLILFCIYIGAACVIYSVFTIEHPKGEEYTPTISVTMQCVINLTFQFFFVYTMIYACVTIKEIKADLEWPLLTNTMENLRGTVMYCPMLAILFVATRMRALRITDNKGAPQGWAQDGMYMATWAVLVQFLFGLLVPLCTGTPCPCDEDGTPQFKPAHEYALYVVQAFKWLTYIFLYGGTIAVIIGVYTMTPETANGRGAIPLAGDGQVPGTDAKVPGYDGVGEPVGVNDAPKVVSF